MMGRAYGYSECQVCGRRLSLAGAGRTNHFRKHVREGRMVQRIVRYGKHDGFIFDMVKPTPAGGEGNDDN